MKKISIIATLLFGMIITSCTPFALVNSEVYNNANLAAYKTFRIVTPADGKMVPGMQMVTYYNISAAIREQMIERGYTEDPESPLLINIGLTVRREIDTAPPPPYWPHYGAWYNGYAPFYMTPRSLYWSNYANARVITGIYREGVLTMDFINVNEKLPLYSASVATIIQNGAGQSAQYRNLKGIAEAVETLFSDFPVKKLPQYRQ